MRDQWVNSISSTIDGPAILAAIVTGTYAATFYVMGNLTMLPVASIFLLWAVLTIPITVAVMILGIVLRKIGLQAFTAYLSLSISVVYLLLALHRPVFQIQAISEFRAQLDGLMWFVFHLGIFLLPAALVAYVFRRSVGKYSMILGVMSLAAIGLGLSVPADSNIAPNIEYRSKTETNLPSVSLAQKPNIYLVLADGFGSLAYMREKNVDVSLLTSALTDSGFRLYDDIFNNYHPTTSAMLAMLNMEHHYYSSTFKESEVNKLGREVIGGQNNLVRLLEGAGYRTEYIHQGNYLLLHGCTADYCFPDATPDMAVRNVLREVLPQTIVQDWPQWQKQPLNRMHDMLMSSLEVAENEQAPRFRYLHLYQPSHAPNDVVGICDEVEQLANYSDRVADTSAYLSTLVDGILSSDQSAVIVIAGDHGPMLANECRRTLDIDSLSDYRDRSGSLLAIRWPDQYQGQFDSQISTTVNLFRYVLASISEPDTAILENLEPDDVYIRGTDSILQIVDGGEIVIPPKNFLEK